MDLVGTAYLSCTKAAVALATPLGRKLAVETSVKDALLSPRASHRASGRSLSGGLPSRRLQSTLALISKLPSLDHDLFSAGVP